MRLVLAELSFGEELWLAAIQAVAIVGGVVVTLLFGISQATKAWDRQLVAQEREHKNQATSDRNSALRTERIALYRRLVHDGITAMAQTAMAAAVRPDLNEDDEAIERADESTSVWESTFAEVQLIGSDAVTEIAQIVDTELRNRGVQRFLRLHDESVRERRVDPDADPTTFGQQVLAMAREVKQAHDQNDRLRPLLISVCRSDIEKLE